MTSTTAAPPTPWARLRGRLTDAASLRSWTIDANDGIVATAGLLEGFAGAGASDSVLVIAATAATVAGALSLGGAKWAEEAAEREAQLAVAAQEEAELAARPDDEVAELAAHYEAKGLDAALARQVAEQLHAHDALAAQLETEHGIDEVMPASAPVWAGVGAGVAFLIGALIPLLITVFVPVRIESWAILGAVVVSLVLTSFVAARIGRRSVVRTLVRSLTVGVGTLAVSYLVGAFFF
jgi:vacuolar iron transporter family protein